MKKTLIKSAAFMFLCVTGAGIAQASFECMGETYSGTIVTVSGETWGAYGSPQWVDVVIEKNGKTTSSYRYTSILHYYESERGENYRDGIVGVNAHDGELLNFVSINYVGKNFGETYQKTLKQHLLDPNRKKQPGNSMTVPETAVWGEGAVFKFKDVVCSLYLDA